MGVPPMDKTLDSGESSVWKIQIAGSGLTHSNATVSPSKDATTREEEVEEEEEGEEEEEERVTEAREEESSRRRR